MDEKKQGSRQSMPEAQEVFLQPGQSAALDDGGAVTLHQAHKHRAYEEWEKAYNCFRQLMLSATKANRPALKQDVLNCLPRLRNLNLVASLEGLEEDIREFRLQPHVDGSEIRPLCNHLFHVKYNHSGAQFKIDQLAEDSFLLDCLANDYFADPEIETFVTEIRRQVLLVSARDLQIHDIYFNLYQVFCIQSYLTDFVLYRAPEEDKIITQLETILSGHISEDELQIRDIAPILLLLSMYKPLLETPAAALLKNLELDDLPEYLHTAFSLTVLEPLDLDRRESGIENAGSIHPDSAAVAEQYGKFPYPRHPRLGYLPAPVNYRGRNPHLDDTQLKRCVLDENPLEILVAGCGTGFQAAQIALSCMNASVTGIDISRRSLAYADRLRESYEIDNLSLLQADITNLPEALPTGQSFFHVVECVGVLHHLADPEAGLTQLLKMLKPGGFINLGLYSEIARQPVQTIRELNEKIHMSPGTENIRQFRRQFMTSKLDDSMRAVLGMRDFYTMNGCKDLLFNKVEHCFTIPRIKSLLEQHNLKFIGFHFGGPMAEQIYYKMFPEERSLRVLDNWQLLEEKFPDTFRQMYRFHCQKPE